MNQTLVEAVLDHAIDEKMKQKIAVAFRKDTLTYQQLGERIVAFAKVLKGHFQIAPREKVMILAVSRTEYVVALLAIQYLGAISIPIEKKAVPDTIQTVFSYSESKVVLMDKEVEGVNTYSLTALYKEATLLSENEKTQNLLEAYRKPVDETLVAEMLFTTGTTGIPKGVMLTYENLSSSIANTKNGVGMLESDVVLVPLPLNHSVGMRVLRTTLFIGASLIIQNGFRFAKELIENIQLYQCTALVSVPATVPIIRKQMKEQFEEVLGTLRYIEFGAGSLSYSMRQELSTILPNTEIINTWGSTETGGAIFLNMSKHPEKYKSLGCPADGIEIKVVDVNGNEIQGRGNEFVGRMALRGKMCMSGYYNMPEENKKTLVDGYLVTNDLVYLDEDGFVYMLGRADSIINVGGKKVSPVEVENIALENNKISECACVGVEDPEDILGQVPVLYYVSKQPVFDVTELKQFLQKKMEEYKVPHFYVRLNQIPRNRMKKIDYASIKKLWEENGANDLMNPVLYNIFHRRSIRRFQDKAISKPMLETLINAGIMAPSGKNMQSWKFTVVQNPLIIEKYHNLVKKVAKEKHVYFYGFHNPAALILVSNSKENPNTIQDSACAVENIMLAANSFGIGSVWLNALKTICEEPEIRAMLSELEVPSDHTVWSTIALGFPAEEPEMPMRKMDVIAWH